jgi:hypothetical protein
MKPRPERKLVPIRLCKADYEKARVKLVEDRLNFQTVMEVLFLGYLKDNKKIREMVMKHSNVENDKKRRQRQLDTLEINEIRQLIEDQHSPLRFLEKISDEVKKEKEKNQ